MRLNLRNHYRRDIGSFEANSHKYTVQILNNFHTPHFIIVRDDERWATSLRMDSPEYWLTNCINVRDMETLRSEKELGKPLNEFFKSKDKDTGLTYWELMIQKWNILNPGSQIATIKTPDYTEAKYSHSKMLRVEKRIKELGETKIPKYELAWYTLCGYDVGALNNYYNQGFRIVGTISCGNPLVLMERPCPDVDELPVGEEIPKE